MAYLSLYRKYRPQTFDEVLGQEHVSRTLKNALAEDRVAHAYLFTGPRGTGKTSTARILAKALNCVKGPTPEPCGECDSCVAIAEGSSLDVFELDAASHSGVDETREILSGVQLATAGGNKKVYVIDEVHMLTTQSFNALLKTLEEPPEHVVFVLATTDPHKVLPTIVSRTQRFDFRRITVDDLERHLADIAGREAMSVEPDALTVIARHAEGSARDALSALDQLASLTEKVTATDAERLLGDRDEDALVELFDAISTHDVGGVFTRMRSLVAQGADPRQLAFAAMEHARALLLIVTAPQAGGLLDVGEADRATLALQAERFSAETLVRILDLVGKAITEMRNAPNHRLLLEVALVRAAAPETDPTATGLLGRIERLERRIGISEGAAAGSGGPEPAAGGGQRPAGRGTEPGSPSSAKSSRARPPSTTSALPADPASSPAQSAAAADPASSPAGSASPAKAGPEAHAPPAETDSRPAVSASGSTASVGLGDVKEAWAVTLAELRKVSVRVAALLNPSRPLAFDGGTLDVEVQSPYHSDEMAVPANAHLLMDALHASLGIRTQVRFIAPGARPTEVVEEDPPDVAAVVAEATTEAQDPVELVRKGLGAEIVEEKSNS